MTKSTKTKTKTSSTTKSTSEYTGGITKSKGTTLKPEDLEQAKESAKTLKANLTPSRIVIEEPTNLTPQQKSLVEEIVGDARKNGDWNEAPNEDAPSVPVKDVPATEAGDIRTEDPKILAQRMKQEENEQITSVDAEKKAHFENTEDLKAQIPDDLPIRPTFSHDELVEALYWIIMTFEKGPIGLVLIGPTGKAAHENKKLSGDGIYCAIRRLEWESGGRYVVETLAQYKHQTDDVMEYVCNNGVPVFIRICEDDYCISTPDSKFYENEWVKLPNPFHRFQEVYGD